MAAIYEYVTSKWYGARGDSGDSKLTPDTVNDGEGKQTAKSVSPLDLNTPVYDDKIRCVCISDTHTYLERNKNYVIPDGDVLLHAGDLTMYGKPDEVHTFNNFLGTLPHPYKVVIAGNHDMSFDLQFLQGHKISPFWTLNNRDFQTRLEAYGVRTVHEMMSNCIYLQDSAVEIYGIKIYGSPWTLGGGKWGFQANRGAQIMEKWNQIPEDTDILMTHSPPCGHGDCSGLTKFKAWLGLNGGDDQVGCVDLLNTVQCRVRPKYHVFGHIHGGYGVTTDDVTTYINAATCTGRYVPKNPPIIFDIPLPQGQLKTKAVSKDVFKALSY